MIEERFLQERNCWRRKYGRRRNLVLTLELIAFFSWLLYGTLSLDVLDSFALFIYVLMLGFLFLPGLVFVMYDTHKMRNVDYLMIRKKTEEDPVFTRTIMRASIFLLIMLALIVIPSFLLLSGNEVFQWTSFFSAVFVLVIATFAGVCWKQNTSCRDELKRSES